MPLMHCMECHHEWESTSDRSLCDWCGAGGYVLEKETHFEKFCGDLANPEFRARLLSDLKERQRFEEDEKKKMLHRHLGVGETPPQFFEQSPSPQVPADRETARDGLLNVQPLPEGAKVQYDKCIPDDEEVKFDKPVRIWGQKTLKKRPSDGTVDMSDSKSDGH